jgi:hypothetical protein
MIIICFNVFIGGNHDLNKQKHDTLALFIFITVMACWPNHSSCFSTHNGCDVIVVA